MQHLSATEARQHFFELLDRAAQGEAVFIDRRGLTLKLVRGESSQKKKKSSSIEYRAHIHSPVDQSDQWSWDWKPTKGLKLKSRKSS